MTLLRRPRPLAMGGAVMALFLTTCTPMLMKAPEPSPHVVTHKEYEGPWSSPTAAVGPRVRVAVLTIDSDDAEEQAGALTVALRSRLRAGTSFDVQETDLSLGTLTAALRCERSPGDACQVRIADQLKVDRLVWGNLQRHGAHEVAAEVHLFRRGRGETTVRDSYTENMKDGSDEGLQEVAHRVLERLMSKPP